jgi:hypothetical protein
VAAVSGALKKGERVAIPGLGIFSVRERAARKGRNPRTGAVINIPARKVVVFQTCKGPEGRGKVRNLSWGGSPPPLFFLIGQIYSH